MGRLEYMGIHPDDIDKADDELFDALEALHFTNRELDDFEERINDIPQIMAGNNMVFETNSVISEMFDMGREAIEDKYKAFFKTHDIDNEIKPYANGYDSHFFVSEDLQEYADKQYKKNKDKGRDK